MLCFSSHILILVCLLCFVVYFTLLGISPLPNAVFHFSLKGPRAHILFAEDDSSQSRNVPNYVRTKDFQLDCQNFSYFQLDCQNVSLI